MKTTKTIILFIALGATLFISCKKNSKEEPTPTNNTTPGTFSAKVNGTTTNFSENYHIVNNGAGGAKGVIISATSGNNKINFTFNDFDGVLTGDHDIDGLWASASYVVGNTQYGATSGTLKITSYSGDKMSGTFSFTAPGYTITQGTFANVLKK